MDALYLQIEFELQRFKASKGTITSMFIGGGTPSTVEAKLYTKIFSLLKPYFKENIEITTEANPNSASKAWLEGMYDLGCTRVSFGVQSFNNTKLKFLGREHNSTQAKEAVKAAHEIGFKHISLDLMYATKVDTKEIIEEDIETAFSLPIDHISAYALTIEENTLFEAHPEAAKEKLSLSKFFINSIKERGFEQYEISNFGKYQCEHNIGYWKLEDYIGAGSGAVGMLKNRRYYPTTNIENYIQNPLEIKEEILSDADLKTEKVLLGLRSNVGIDLSILDEKQIKQVTYLEEEKKVTRINNKIFNTNYLLSDEIALFILG